MNRGKREGQRRQGAGEYLRLFWSFCCIGALTFGGGYSMLPMIHKEVVEKHQWATEQEVVDFFALSQCVPGVIAVNAATFIGHKVKGVLGAILAVLGVVLPSLLIILAIAAFLKDFLELELVRRAFGGIRVAVVALIVQAICKLWKKGVVDIPSGVLCGAAFVLVAVLGVSPIYVVLGAALAGIALGRIARHKA